ncbi:MAG: thiol reductant ABC exporter subunit CydD [Nocardioidaceae bacterium]
MRPLDRRLLQLLRPAAPALTGLLAAGVLGCGLVVAQMFALTNLLVIVVGGRVAQLPSAAMLLLAAVLGRSLVGLAADLCAARASATVTRHLVRRIVEATLDLPAQDLSSRRSGELSLLATRGVAAIDPYLTRYLPAMVLALVLPPLTLVAIGTQDLMSAAIVVVTLPLAPVFAVLVGLATRDRAASQWRMLSSLAGHFVDVMRGLPTLVVHRRAAAQSATIRRVTDEHRRASLDTLRLAFASSAVLELVATLSVALVAVTVGLRLAAGSLDLRTALVVLLLAPEAYWPLRRVGAEFHGAAEGTATLAAAHDLFAVVPETPPADPEGPPPWSGLNLPTLRVTYPGRQAPALDLRTPVHLGPRSLVAVTGPSGSGKSTLLSVLAGEVTATGNGAPLAGSRSPADWRQDVSWIPQRPWLRGGTVRGELLVARPNAADHEVWAALRRVGLSDLVAGLPDGLDSPVGEDGSRLSAGQRARFTLARAVVAQRPLVLVDEPSSHLDAATERIVIDVLRWLSLDATVVVVTHSEPLVVEADQVIELSAPAGAPAAPVVRADLADPVPSAVSTDASRRTGPGRWQGSAADLLGVLASVSGIALTVTSGWLITRASQHPPLMLLMVAIVGVRAFGIARPALRYAERVVGHDGALRMLAERRAAVYDVLVPLTPGALGRRRGDVLASVVDDVDALLDDRLRVRAPLISLVAVGALGAAASALLLPSGSIVVVGLVVVVLAIAALVRWSVARVERDLVRHRSLLSDRVLGVVQGARDLVMWQAAGQALDDVEGASDRLRRSTRRSDDRVACGRAAVLASSGIALALMAAVAGRAVDAHVLGPAAAAALLLVPLGLVEVLMVAPDAAATSVRTAAAKARLAGLAATAPAVSDPPVSEPAVRRPRRLCVDGLAAGWEQPVFAGLSLDVPTGSRIGVVGPSGSGKSTLAAQLVRFVDPTSGRVALDDTDLRALALDDVHRTVGLLDDDPYVFSTSVLENVRLARPGATRSEVASALREVSLGPWLDTLPDGLDSLVGDGHDAVSGGERARLGLARTLLADHPVLVLDEPTAHLDTSTAHEVARDVLRATEGRTVVWITHDTVGLVAMDRVVDLASYAPLPRRLTAATSG